MEPLLNRQVIGPFGSLEQERRSILRSDPAARIDVSIDIDYPPGSARPSEIAVQYSVDGGANEIRVFEQ